MDKDFAIFALIKGKDYVVQQTGLSDQEVELLSVSMKQLNHTFFKKIIDLMIELSISTSIEYAAEFFGVTIEVFKAITDRDQEKIYLDKIKQSIKSRSLTDSNLPSVPARESNIFSISKPQQGPKPPDALPEKRPILESSEPSKESVSIPAKIGGIRNPNNYSIKNKLINIKELSEHQPKNKNIQDPDYSRVMKDKS